MNRSDLIDRISNTYRVNGLKDYYISAYTAYVFINNDIIVIHLASMIQDSIVQVVYIVTSKILLKENAV